MHWNRKSPVPVLVFSSPGLREIPTTSLTRRADTVTLNKSKVPAVLGWLAFAGIVGIALSRRSSHRMTYYSGPDAIDELAEERERIMRRVASKSKKRRAR